MAVARLILFHQETFRFWLNLTDGIENYNYLNSLNTYLRMMSFGITISMQKYFSINKHGHGTDSIAYET